MIVAGLDIGNGYTKCKLSSDVSRLPVIVDIPSAVAPITRVHDVKDPDVDYVFEDLYNRMDVSFDSTLITDTNRRLFGTAALRSGVTLEEFDVYSDVSKAQSDLSSVLILGVLAGMGLTDYYKANKSLPDEILKCECMISLALPVVEYKKHRKLYAEKLKAHSHIVTFHNFEKPVRVEIFIKDVQVLAEGQPAQYAITRRDSVSLESMIDAARAHGMSLEGITYRDIVEAKSSLSIDIGEGTVNFPVFSDGKFDDNVSDSFNKGYGRVLTQALDRLNDMGYRYDSRKRLAEFLNTEPSVLKRGQYNITKQVVDEEIAQFTDELFRSFTKILSKVESYVEVIYVYGGGATAVKDWLFDRLIEVSRVNGVDRFLVLYLDSEFSRYLNMEGLYIVSEALAKKFASKGENNA